MKKTKTKKKQQKKKKKKKKQFTFYQIINLPGAFRIELPHDKTNKTIRVFAVRSMGR